MGAGAFIALALSFCTTSFSDDQLKKIDRMTVIPLAVVLVGFIISFLHLATPLKSFGVFVGVGSSPLSNEILVGSIFVVLAILYGALALAGKLKASVRKIFAVIVAIMAIVFSFFMGAAYMIETIASWNTLLVPVQIVGFALLGGMALGTYVLGLADALENALKSSFRAVAIALIIVGVLMAVAGLALQVLSVSTLSNSLVSGAELVEGIAAYLAVAVVLLVLAAVANLMAFFKSKSVTIACVSTLLAFVGILVARFVFYALELSVGLSI